MTPINFKANFLKTVYIPHTTNKGISEKEVSIVELDKNDKKDIDALTEIAWKWEGCASGYAFEIYNDAKKYKPYPDVYKEHYLALTTQKSDYANLEPDKVLGLALFEEKDAVYDELAWLQANPMTNHECKKGNTIILGKAWLII